MKLAECISYSLESIHQSFNAHCEPAELLLVLEPEALLSPDARNAVGFSCLCHCRCCCLIEA